MKVSFLESFDAQVAPAAQDPEGDVGEEERRLASFEQGYRAGWDDAIKAQTENTKIATEEFANALKDLSFTYHEALGQLTVGLAPFLNTLIDQLVPIGLDASLNADLVQRLQDTAKEKSPTEIQIVCAPERSGFLKSILSADLDMPVKIIADADLDRDAVSIRFGLQEEQIDLTEIADHIEEAIEAFNFQARKDLANG